MKPNICNEKTIRRREREKKEGFHEANLVPENTLAQIIFFRIFPSVSFFKKKIRSSFPPINEKKDAKRKLRKKINK